MKSLLLFLAGLLVGANLVYFVMQRDRTRSTAAPAITPSSACPSPASAASPEIAPAPAAGSRATQQPVQSPRLPRLPTTVPPASAPSAVETPFAGTLLIPVQGVAAGQLTDTFNDLRGGTRIHEALDIMAARGTPVLAASDGTVAKLFTSVPGGLTMYEFDPTRRYAYYYAHLDRYAEGLADGKPLKRGELIGYVGSTGNASPDAPHLHFAIFVLGPEKQWWKGAAVNPYPLLTGAR